MEIEKYGVKLTRLTRDKIELVRQWRNSECVRRYMIFQQEITPEMQRKWFESLHNDMNYYFIVSHNGEQVGVANIKEIVWSEKSAELGIFIARESSRNGDIALRAVLSMIDFCFEELHLEVLLGKVKRDNLNALSFNRAFGFVEDSSVSHDSLTIKHSVLTPENYYRQRPRLIDLIT